MSQGYLNRNSFKTKEKIVNEGKAFAYTTLTVDNTIQNIPLSAITTEATMVHLYFESSVTGKAARYTYDGTNPVAATTGNVLKDDTDFFLYEMENISKFKIVQETAGTHTLHITYLK